eukprot:372196_1
MSWFGFGDKKKTPKPEESYKIKLDQLEKLGYKNRDKNLQLLKLYSGDVNHVIQDYEAQQPSSKSSGKQDNTPKQPKQGPPQQEPPKQEQTQEQKQDVKSIIKQALPKSKEYSGADIIITKEIQIICEQNKQKDEQIAELTNRINVLESKLRQYDSGDIEEQTNMMLSTFTETELKQTLQSDEHTFSSQQQNAPTTHDEKSESFMNWNNVCQCVKQQMWPKLSSAIKSIVDSLDGDNVFLFWDNVITNDSIDIVINKLKEKRHLQIEERKYLQKLIYRTKNFTPIVNNHYYQGFIQGKISSEMKTIYHSSKTLNEALLMDIFDVHRIFVFSNFNFRNYSATDFTKD